jgi:hypothetical protein
MFERAKKTGLDLKEPKRVTFGNDAEETEEEVANELPDVEALLKNMDKEIKDAKQREKNATIAKIYSSTNSKQSEKQLPSKTSTFDSCGCFGK